MKGQKQEKQTTMDERYKFSLFLSSFFLFISYANLVKGGGALSI
jgi:hypothetical protein